MLYLLWKWQMVEGFCNTVFANVLKSSISIFMPKLRGMDIADFQNCSTTSEVTGGQKLKIWKLKESLLRSFSTNKINSVPTSEATRGHQRPPEAKTLINSSKDAFLRLQLNSKVDQQPRINRIFDLWGHLRPKIAFRGWCNSWKKTFFRLCWTPKLFSDLEFRKPNYLISDLWGHWRPKPENYYWRHLSRIFNYCARLL